MKKIHKFFSKDLLHILGAVGIFVAFLISIAYKQVGIGALIAAWLIAMAIIGVAWIDVYKRQILKLLISKRHHSFDWSICFFSFFGLSYRQVHLYHLL